ncbi:MAG TPA: 7-carboxy-7-deazaguanine synthase QueE [Burkholderiales bacterium]|nr:7-carboxy-7-deazaguanine synthase QueE [Burkholderiales bacterium]
MHRPPTLRTIEVFASVQGEGLRMGEPAIFVRLAGCNLRCSYCDTKRAWGRGRARTVAEILAEVRALHRDFPARWACLTGGEPLRQTVAPLIRALRKDGLAVQVETNGTFAPRPAADWYTVSPTPPDYAAHPLFRRKAKEVKLVVSRGLTVDDVRAVRRAFPPGTPVILQPQSNARWSMQRAVRILKEASCQGLSNIRVGVQLHKIYRMK